MSYPDPVEFLLLSMPELKADLDDRLQKGYSQTYDSANVCGKLMELADIVLDDLRKGMAPFQKSKQILAVLEEFLQIHGDQDPHSSLEVCFFETMITPLIHGEENIQGPLKTFVSFLGPESIKSCQQNDTFWGTKTPFLYGPDNSI
jgi:hypothetical protein